MNPDYFRNMPFPSAPCSARHCERVVWAIFTILYVPGELSKTTLNSKCLSGRNSKSLKKRIMQHPGTLYQLIFGRVKLKFAPLPINKADLQAVEVLRCKLADLFLLTHDAVDLVPWSSSPQRRLF